MRPTTKKDLCIPREDNFRLVITVSGGPDSLAGYEGEMQIRKTKTSTEVLAEMDKSWFTIDDLTRQVVLEIPNAETGTYDWTGQALYDLHIDDGTDRWRLLEGRVSLNMNVTEDY
jgi:hypothetical protein